MEVVQFAYELIGLIIAASLVALLTQPAETEFSRKALARYAKRRQKKFNLHLEHTESQSAKSAGAGVKPGKEAKPAAPARWSAELIRFQQTRQQISNPLWSRMACKTPDQDERATNS